ncbi:pyridoxal-phosphate dependent enzyme [Micromonospora sp. WMMC415]|uniref:1-aminocyclopropane-1-carboxylate deaminase/D-cysteine desulfhydrase n=1 Tax=Micromonospora sp. WMMC415 TaxID=2675222 RepID=UPI0012B472EC|nr:pyridoxal-phosphate dependent enzyme [Micromonospora sp. WMMC415]QGN48620.1 pyridoxal-phosphate dependent enzyme [Micromonospora sp. WMMC415]
MQEPQTPTPLHEVADPVLASAGITLLMKRDDLIHPSIPGNKWRKLKHNLGAARESGADTILTFGGAYSNHIYAAASAGKLFGFKAIGVIRGEEHLPLNDVLRHAVGCGMELDYLDRDTYRRKYDADVLTYLRDRHGAFYLLPEGGTNCHAVRGCAEIIDEIDVPFDYICCPMGTGGTLTGLIAGLAGRAHALGFSSLKGATFLEGDVRSLLSNCGVVDQGNWTVMLGYHFGGFAKRKPELLEFIEKFGVTHGIGLDFVYTGKMMYGLFDLTRKGFFQRGSRIIVVHTGGVDASRTD